MIFNNNKELKQYIIPSIVLLSGVLSATVMAETVAPTTPTKMVEVVSLDPSTENSYSELKAVLKGLISDADPDSIEETAMLGIYEVAYGSTVFYFNKDASMMFRGDLIDVRKRVNLTEEKRGQARSQLLASMDESQMIIYPAKNEKAKVTVFTDIDCPYCVKLHREMEDYNAEGITIRYMAYPRAGIGSPSYQKAVNVWCADKPNEAMSAAKEGQVIAKKTCNNPVAQQFKLGQKLGVEGTPAMFLENGTSLPGYVPAKRLAQALNK
jgi:thiol:disulfide interchange protein DsbC